MGRQEFNTIDVVRLEVETDPTGLTNLVQNPSGELGGWGWITPVAGSALAGGSNLVFSGVAGASWFTTEALPIAAGQYAAARLTALAGTTVTHFRVRFEWLNAAGALLSSAVQSGYLPVASPNVQYGPIVAPASTAYVRLRFDLYTSNTGTNPAGAHTFTFREVTVAKAATSGALGSVRANLVANPSFETSTTGWGAAGVASLVRRNLIPNPSFEVNTTGWLAEAGDSIARTTAQALVGTASLAVTGGAARTATGTAGIPVVPGTLYTLRASVRAAATVRSGSFQFDYYNSSGAKIQTASNGAFTDSASGWTSTTTSTVAPAGAAFLSVVVLWTSAGTSEVHYLDAVLLEDAATYTGTYFDGATPDAGGVDYAWTGTAHASASTATRAGAVLSTAAPAGVPVGTKALAITLDAAAPAGIVRVTGSLAAATFGADYALQAKVMSPVATTARLRLWWAKADGTFLGTSNGATFALAAGAWTSKTLVASAPWADATRVTAQVEFDTPGAGAVHYVDAVMIEQASAVGTYFDGNTPDAGGIDYAWTGTANESQSTATTSNLAYIEPVQYLNIIGQSQQIRIPREALNVGTLSATIRSSTLDPSQSDLIRPGRRARLTALVAGQWKTLIGGKLLEADVTYEVKDPNLPAEKRAKIEVLLVDPMQTLANAGRPEGVATIPELPFVLEGAGVPWNINGSGNQVPTAAVTTYNDGAKALDQVALTRDTRLGYAWMSRLGVLNVWDRSQLASGSPVVIDEDDYSDIDLSFSTKDAINEVQITVQSLGTDGTTVETVYGPYEDAASIDEWGRYRKEFTVTGLNSAAVDALAAAILAAASTPRIRVNSVTLPLTTLARVNAHALRDLYDEVRIQLGSLGIDDTLRVTGLEHTIDTKAWMLRLDFSDEGGVASPTVQPPVQSGARPDVGVIELFAGTTIPANKLRCDGASYPVADYPYLFAVIGYTYGGAGAFFNVPNLTDRFPIGSGTKALGSIGGGATKVIAAGNLPPHAHTINHGHSVPMQYSSDVPTTGAGVRIIRINGAGAGGTGGTDATITVPTFSGSSGNGPGASTPMDVMNPWLSLNFVIRAA